MRKKILLLLVLFCLAYAPFTLAQGFIPLAPIPGLTDPATATSVVNSNNFAVFFNSLYKYCIGLSAALAVIMIIWGGLEISTQDSISKQGAGKERITQAIYGLILVLSPVLVFSLINPQILNLSLSLQPISFFAGSAPVNTSSCQPGVSSDTAACIEQQISQCTNGGGTPTQTTDSHTGVTTVSCETAGVTAATDSILLEDCVATAGKQSVTTSHNCSNATAEERDGKLNCRNWTTPESISGICIW